MRRRVLTLLAALAAASTLLTAAPAEAGTAASPAGPSSPGTYSPGTYSNPLTLALPGGGTAASCADPFVFKGVGGDRHWYLYCTSDALTSTERTAAGDPVIHLLPTYRSTDLVHWRYTGDALAARPAWATSDAGLYAPDVVRSGGRYLMYYAASATTFPGAGSAIGVLTAPTPTGPWTDSGRPVVAPVPDPGDPSIQRATIDPEVITDHGTTYLYFGSYPGGVFVRRLAADGLSSNAASERRIAIDNRYEGAFLVHHDGWWYFMGSATNCCNGALTGYGVFTARSRSPLGPFLDRDGRSILATRVGGTPVLASNGNRWTGPGHNAVITDATGQQWIVYHAVDQDDPYYAGEGTYTKRPVLMDPLDWRDGWPVVRGGRGPSDTPQPAPAAQPGERAAYHVHFAAPARTGRTIAALSDSFSSSALSARWTWIRQPAADTYSVHDGRFDFATQAADIHPPTAPLASVLTEPAPHGDWTVTTRVKVTTPATGDSYNYVQGGLVVYGSDADYVKLTSNSIFDTRQTEFGRQAPAFIPGAPTYGNGVVGPVGSWTWLRIARHVVEGKVAYTASTSLDGRRWDVGGTWTADLSAHPRIGLVSLGGAGYTSEFDFVRVTALR